MGGEFSLNRGKSLNPSGGLGIRRAHHDVACRPGSRVAFCALSLTQLLGEPCIARPSRTSEESLNKLISNFRCLNAIINNQGCWHTLSSSSFCWIWQLNNNGMSSSKALRLRSQFSPTHSRLRPTARLCAPCPRGSLQRSAALCKLH